MSQDKLSWISIVGGNNWIITSPEEWSGGFSLTDIFWLDTVIYHLNTLWCRFHGHVLDGTELYFSPAGDRVICSCARCYYWKREMHVSEVAFQPDLVSTIREIMEDDPSAAGPDWSKMVVEGEKG